MPSPFGLLKRVFSRNKDGGDNEGLGSAYLGASWNHEPTALPRPPGAYPRSPFSPEARGQEAVSLFLRGEPDAIARLSAEQERASRLVAEAPRTAGTRETLEWVETGSPQALEQVLVAQRRAASRLRRSRLSLFPRAGTGDQPHLKASPVDEASSDTSAESAEEQPQAESSLATTSVVPPQVEGLRRRNLTPGHALVRENLETSTWTGGRSRYIEVGGRASGDQGGHSESVATDSSERDEPAGEQDRAKDGAGVLDDAYWQVQSQPGSSWSSSSSSSSGSDGFDEDQTGPTVGEGQPSRLVDRFPEPPLGSGQPLSADGGKGKSTDTKTDDQEQQGKSTGPGFPPSDLGDDEDDTKPAIPPRNPRRESSPQDLDAIADITLDMLPSGGEGEQGRRMGEDWGLDLDDSDQLVIIPLKDSASPAQNDDDDLGSLPPGGLVLPSNPVPPGLAGPLPPHLQAFLEHLAASPPPRPAPAPPRAAQEPALATAPRGVAWPPDNRPVRIINNFRAPGFKQYHKPLPPAFYHFSHADGRARLAELRAIFGLSERASPQVVLLGLLASDRSDRATVTGLHPGVAARANQVDWHGVDLGFGSLEEQQLYDAWLDSGEDLFPPFEPEEHEGRHYSDYLDGYYEDGDNGEGDGEGDDNGEGADDGGDEEDRDSHVVRKPGLSWFPAKSRLAVEVLPEPEVLEAGDEQEDMDLAGSPCHFPLYY